MTSTFSGISTALSSLYAQRRALDVTGQNIANVNTDGYSRQSVQMQSVGGSTVPAMFSRSDGVGQGVQVTSVTRTRDEFVEAQGRSAHARDQYLTGQQNTLSTLEQTFNEPSDNGLASKLGHFWSSLGDLANNPGAAGGGASAARSLVLENAQTVVDTIHGQHQTLSDLWDATRQKLGVTADDVNSTAASIADLNSAIGRASAAGIPANDLSDQRDLLVMHLSEQTGATATAGKNGMVDVTLAGHNLVSGGRSDTVSVVGATTLATAGTGVSLQWSNGGTATVSSGAAASVLNSLNTTIPTYGAKLDNTASALITSVNAVHQNGYDLDGTAGGAFFSGTSATDIGVAITDPRKIAASDTAGGNLGDGNAAALAGVASDPGGPDAAYQKLVVGLGVQSATAASGATAQSAATQLIDSRRESVSGVSLDEEMTNLLQFQRAYEAASRVLSTIDSMLGTLINNTGVGR